MVDGIRSGFPNLHRLLQDEGVSPEIRAELNRLNDGLEDLDSFLSRHGGTSGNLSANFGSASMRELRSLAAVLSGQDSGGAQGADGPRGYQYDPSSLGGFDEVEDGDPDAPGAAAKSKGLKKAMKALNALGGGGMGMMMLGAMLGGAASLAGLGKMFQSMGLGGGGGGGGNNMNVGGGGGGGNNNVGGGGGGGGGGQSFNALSSNMSDVGGAGPKYGKKRIPPHLEALMHGGGLCFEDLVAKFMVDTVREMQNEAKAKMNEIKNSISKKDGGGGGGGGGGTGGAEGGAGDDSRNLMFEELKYIMQKLSQVQQALSNVLNTMHEQAMSSIRHIKV